MTRKKTNLDFIALQILAKMETLKELMEKVWLKMEELENAIKTIRANNIPIRVDHLRKDSKTENNLSSSKSKVPKEVSAKALLCFFKKIHLNDAPLVVMKTDEESSLEVFERRKGIENPMIKKFQNILDSKSGGSFSKSSRTSNWSKRGLKSFKKQQI